MGDDIQREADRAALARALCGEARRVAVQAGQGDPKCAHTLTCRLAATTVGEPLVLTFSCLCGVWIELEAKGEERE